MGFGRDQAIDALKICDNDVSKAIEYIFNGFVEEPKPRDTETSSFQDSGFQSQFSQTFEPANTTHLENVRQQQESGTIDSEPQYKSNAQFGPATRDDYESGQWGIVPYQSAGSEYSVTAFEPTLAVRKFDSPPLLIPSSEMLYIAPLITILHSIPLARKMLLTELQIEDYGFDPNWWKDTPIDMTDKFDNPAKATHSQERLIAETQRLIAFLDGGSKRAMASIYNLANEAPLLESVDALRGMSSVDSPPGRFIEDIMLYWGADHEFAKVFSMGAEGRSFVNLIADVTVDFEKSLYDVIDELVWPPNTSGDTYLEYVGEIIHITLKRDDGNSGAGIIVPTDFYPGRYLKENVGYVKELSRRKADTVQQLATLNSQKFRLSTTMGKDTSKLLQITHEYLQEANEGSSGDESKQSLEDGNDDSMNDDTSNSVDGSMTQALLEVTKARENFEARKAGIMDEINKLNRQMEIENSLFKGPHTSEFSEIFNVAEPPQLTPYRLSGAIISPNEYCFRSVGDSFDEDLIELDGESNEPVSSWWRVAPNAANEFVASKVSEVEVLDRIKEGSREFSWQEVILVYSTDKALKEDPTALNAKLQKFINSDKKVLIRQVQQQDEQQHQQRQSQPPQGERELEETLVEQDSDLKLDPQVLEPKIAREMDVDQGQTVEILSGVEPEDVTENTEEAKTLL
uniref:ARAD1B23210p n=1 Tax=Blastobotrys adeninivorans TaxID=409370 RepID=A0A060T7V9_BLAAD